MTRIARLFFIIAFMSAAGSCSIELAEKEADTKAMGRQLTDAYYSCVRTSFASQRPTMVDRNMAIDQAFMVCKTEESKLQAFEKSSFSFGPPRYAERRTLAAIDVEDRRDRPRDVAPASPRACGMAPRQSAQASPGGARCFGGLSALNAIRAQNASPLNARPTTTLWPMAASFMYAAAPSGLGKPWLWTLASGYHHDRTRPTAMRQRARLRWRHSPESWRAGREGTGRAWLASRVLPR